MLNTIRPYIQLLRLDKPIGTLLLFWPTMQAILLCTGDHPQARLWIGFALGTLLMRSAGCVINDMADKDFDKHVKRTAQRPLASGKLSRRQALPVLLIVLLLSAALLLLYDKNTLIWSIPALILALCYPFMKRYTNFPQLVLGAAFSWSIPMAFVASKHIPNSSTWILFFASLAWVIAYDTQYAMVDRDDDLVIGIKSTAIFFGKYDLSMIGLFQALYLAGILRIAIIYRFQLLFYPIFFIIIFMFIKQYTNCKNKKPENCFKAFLNNNRIGLLMCMGFYLGLQ